jgi:hypothetical protein
MNEAATKSTTVKARYSAKPKLKVWTPKIKDLLENMRRSDIKHKKLINQSLLSEMMQSCKYYPHGSN